VSSQGYHFYSGSNDVNAVAWIFNNSSDGTKVVGSKAANELAIHDMSGNVFEWCWDVYDPYPSSRRLRGGSWDYDAGYCTVAYRAYAIYPGNRDVGNGFRLARNIGPKISISGTMPEPTLNQAYAGYTFTASGVTGAPTWSLSSGSLPPGMSFNATTATLSGTPTTSGAYAFVVRLDSGGYSDEVDVLLQVSSMILVQGGTLPQSSELAGQTVATFQIGKYEVASDEWLEVRAYAVENGYDLHGVGWGSSPGSVKFVNWYDAVKWCNAKSEMEGLTPVYLSNGMIYKVGQLEPTLDSTANGYRLPSEPEWEWAARGGISSKGYIYSGSNDVNAVALYYDPFNGSGDAISAGAKMANELGIHDMSGSMWEWCWDTNALYHRIRGGSWYSNAGKCAVASRSYDYYDGSTYRIDYIGFRVAKNTPN
jgi:formylglycine-generating enzyme required for sulfatase activity